MALPPALTRKIGPLQTWQWAGVTALTAGAYLWWRRRNAASSSTTAPVAAGDTSSTLDPFSGDTSGLGGVGTGATSTGGTPAGAGTSPFIPGSPTNLSLPSPAVTSSLPAGVTLPGLTALAGFIPGGAIDLSGPAPALSQLAGTPEATSPLYALSGAGTIPGETVDFPTANPANVVAHVGNGNPYGTYTPVGVNGNVPAGSYGTGPTGTYGG